MKLNEIASKSIEILKSRGLAGISNVELAELIGTTKRRVYDVIAILKAAELINSERASHGTHLIWKGSKVVKQVNKIAEHPITASGLKVWTTGTIYNVSNRGKSVIIELDNEAELNIESI